MTIGNLKLYDIFRNDLHLPDDKALEVVNALDDHYERKSSAKIEQLATKGELWDVKNELKQDIHTLATRMDLMATKEELSNVKNELKQDIHKLATRMDLMATKEELSVVKNGLTLDIQKVKAELTTDIQKVKSELLGTIQDVKAELIKSVHYAAIAQFIAIVAALVGIIRYCFVR
ncbi:putative amino acid-binding ACT domain protein [Chitinophaga sp. W3I9]|uniref:hypothetical protein n=1 Tax=Chitinophaga sp. W3I9 TaxID=3373924 RepID=UPI003D23AE8F